MLCSVSDALPPSVSSMDGDASSSSSMSELPLSLVDASGIFDSEETLHAADIAKEFDPTSGI